MTKAMYGLKHIDSISVLNITYVYIKSKSLYLQADDLILQMVFSLEDPSVSIC